jgi:hypothetical protein
MVQAERFCLLTKAKKAYQAKAPPNYFSLSWSQTGETETQEPTEKKGVRTWKFRVSDGHKQSKFTFLGVFHSFFPCLRRHNSRQRKRKFPSFFPCLRRHKSRKRKREFPSFFPCFLMCFLDRHVLVITQNDMVVLLHSRWCDNLKKI